MLTSCIRGYLARADFISKLLSPVEGNCSRSDTNSILASRQAVVSYISCFSDETLCSNGLRKELSASELPRSLLVEWLLEIQDAS